MSVVYLIGGKYETRVRRPHEPAPHPLPREAEVIVLPMIRMHDEAHERMLRRRRGDDNGPLVAS